MTVTIDDVAPPASDMVSLREATRVWAKVGILSFGGLAGQIAVMHRELVEKRRWISDAHFLHALNYCMLSFGLRTRAGRIVVTKIWPLPQVGSITRMTSRAAIGLSGRAARRWAMTGSSALLMRSCTSASGVYSCQ